MFVSSHLNEQAVFNMLKLEITLWIFLMDYLCN